MVFYLAQDQEAQDKVAAEIETVIGDREIQGSDLDKLT